MSKDKDLNTKDEDLNKLKQELETVKAQAEEYLNGWKRAKADYINREREIEKEKIAWIKFANLELILNLLPILDSFEQSVKNLSDNLKKEEWTKGILKIKEQFENFLKAQGIEKIKTTGEKFNPDLHEAVALSSDLSSKAVTEKETSVKAEEKGEKGEIIEEVQAGYTMHGQVIRPAKVIVK